MLTVSWVRMCEVRLDLLDLGSAARALVHLARQGRGAAVHLCNAFTLASATRDPEYAELLNRGDLNLVDGAPVAWAARRFAPIRQRPAGPDLLLRVLETGAEAGLRHYLYGGTPEVSAELQRSLPTLVPGVRIVGAESPPFRALSPEEQAATAARIIESGADVVWVGLGTPKQDRFIAEFRDRVPTVLVAVGAAFDFHARAKRRAPRWMRRIGLEWLFRLLSEPRRLWKRYLVGNIVFLAGLARGVGPSGHRTLGDAPPSQVLTP